MDYLRAVVLGIVQGLTEFLPVSSSGHLILIPRLFGWEDQGLSFDVGLHLGTLLALLLYFWRDWWRMARALAGDATCQRLNLRRYSFDSRLVGLILLGSVPAAVVGLLFSDWIEEHVRQPWLVAITLAVVGTIMLVVDRRARVNRASSSIGLLDVVLIGTAQAVALIPGVSRSGATMTVGLARGLKRDDAARFAFLLGTPAFAGAALLKAGDLTDGSSTDGSMLIVGFAVSAVVGFAVIHYLLRYLRTRSLLPFVLYRYGVAALALIIGAVRIA